MVDKIHNGTVRVVAMVPVEFEFEFSGTDALLHSVCEHMVERKYPQKISSWHPQGPVDDFYKAKLVETAVIDPDPEEIDLNDMIAPGLT